MQFLHRNKNNFIIKHFFKLIIINVSINIFMYSPFCLGNIIYICIFVYRNFLLNKYKISIKFYKFRFILIKHFIYLIVAN